MKKNILLIALVVAVAAAVVAYYQYNKPKRTAEEEKPAAVMSADDLFLAFANDEAAANTAYLNKVIQVSGKVVSTEIAGNETIIYLETSDIMGMVSCTLAAGQENSLEEGQEATLKGICSGFLNDVQLTQAAIVTQK